MYVDLVDSTENLEDDPSIVNLKVNTWLLIICRKLTT
jgi:hypothetical protein